ncbi:MAG TPA: galactokinase family protein, partial [Rhodothermales bacterium]|nr:galactokinase family protein [Rhodothermales bacterium]
MIQTQVLQRFREHYSEEPAFLVRAPGRVNLIGEHTDYNDGFVLPIAIDRAIWIALRARSDQHVAAYSLDYEEAVVFDLNDLKHEEAGWGEYVKGVAWVLHEEGHKLAGWEGVIGGDVPRGAGLSSSAAVELAVARAFAATSELAWNPTTMARLGQRVENEWIGVNCGIMDQMVVASAQEGAALLIDCRSLDTKPVSLPKQTTVAVLDTGTRRGLVDSA